MARRAVAALALLALATGEEAQSRTPHSPCWLHQRGRGLLVCMRVDAHGVAPLAQQAVLRAATKQQPAIGAAPSQQYVLRPRQRAIQAAGDAIGAVKYQC